MKWEPGDDICFIFDDKTAETRSPDEIQNFIDDLKKIANRHDFDLSQFGTRSGFAQFFHRYYKKNGKHKDL
jgi:hypothetical protein